MHGCTAPIEELTAEEVEKLDSLPDAAHQVEPVLRCELEMAHAGPHYALGQTQDNGTEPVKNWWLRWHDADEIREWVHDADCDASASAGATHEDCLHPAGHEGAHSWA